MSKDNIAYQQGYSRGFLKGCEGVAVLQDQIETLEQKFIKSTILLSEVVMGPNDERPLGAWSDDLRRRCFKFINHPYVKAMAQEAPPHNSTPTTPPEREGG